MGRRKKLTDSWYENLEVLMGGWAEPGGMEWLFTSVRSMDVGCDWGDLVPI